MNNTTVIDKTCLFQAMSACVENGERLYEDAEWLGSERSPTVVALCILAQEEFAKAFLLHLVSEGVIPWTAKVQESLRNHKHKQLIGLIMEWLSPSHDAFWARLSVEPGIATLPVYVADAIKLYVENVLPPAYIFWLPAASNRIAKNIAQGGRDNTKQDSLYVRLSEDGNVISVPSQITAEIAEAELERTKRLSDLVSPLREGKLRPVLDYDLLVETLRFLLLDKSNRPFLLLEGTKFSGPVTLSTGTIWSHSISVRIENISDEQATGIRGYATVFLDKEVVRPTLAFDHFTLDAYTTARWTVPLSEESYACGMSPSHKLDLYIDFEYHRALSDGKYHASVWSTYDLTAKTFRETFTDVRESAMDGIIVKSENRWIRPITAEPEGQRSDFKLPTSEHPPTGIPPASSAYQQSASH